MTLTVMINGGVLLIFLTITIWDWVNKVQEQQYYPVKSKVTAAWFAAFLGGVGADLFYLNRRALGLLALAIFGSYFVLHFGGRALTERAWDRLRFSSEWVSDILLGSHSGMDEKLKYDSQYQLGIHCQWLAQYVLAILGLFSLIRAVVLFAMDQRKFDKIFNGGRSSGPSNQTGSGMTSTLHSAADEITKIHKLKQDGVLSEEEFVKAKQKLVG